MILIGFWGKDDRCLEKKCCCLKGKYASNPEQEVHRWKVVRKAVDYRCYNAFHTLPPRYTKTTLRHDICRYRLLAEGTQNYLNKEQKFTNKTTELSGRKYGTLGPKVRHFKSESSVFFSSI